MFSGWKNKRHLQMLDLDRKWNQPMVFLHNILLNTKIDVFLKWGSPYDHRRSGEWPSTGWYQSGSSMFSSESIYDVRWNRSMIMRTQPKYIPKLIYIVWWRGVVALITSRQQPQPRWWTQESGVRWSASTTHSSLSSPRHTCWAAAPAQHKLVG